jgi:hypothetical protein
MFVGDSGIKLEHAGPFAEHVVEIGLATIRSHG